MKKNKTKDRPPVWGHTLEQKKLSCQDLYTREKEKGEGR